jgi:hypothetical protein
MTTQPLDRECDYFDTALAHQRRGPWVEYARELHVRRQKCAAPKTDFEIFRELADSWRRETWYQSSTNRRVSHPAYLKIIGFGKQAIPWILQELRQQPDYWFAALEAISRDPSPNVSASATNVSTLRDAWLEWGRTHGY